MKRNPMLVVLLLLMSSLLSTMTSAQLSNNDMQDLFSDEPQFLPVDDAFQFDFSQTGDKLVVQFDIADGYYLYKKQFKVVTKNATLGEPTFPPAQQIEDEFFGISDVFFDRVAFTYPIENSIKDGVVKLRYQGCASAGLCYPPTTKVIYLNAVGETDNTISAPLSAPATSQPETAPVVSQQFDLADKLQQESLPITLALFLLLGVGLAFTPCVFPMYPIVSGIVIGQGKEIKASRAFSLSFVYVQGMAITYSLLGLVVASAGVQFQAALQHPAILITFIVLFVALAAAMFGAYEIQLPGKWQEKLTGVSNAQQRGSLTGVFVMGVLSGLIASPCTTAPLTGILLFIAQSGDLLLGFLALYALSLGMGIPLIIFAMTGGKLLPKAGNWMNVVKTTFGFMLLSVAIIFVERLWNSEYTWLLWSGLGLAMFGYFQVINQSSASSFWKGVRSIVIFLGLFGSAMLGYQTVFNDVQTNANTSVQHKQQAVSHPEFLVVKDLQDFQQKLADANAQGKSVMVDLYADWCVACKEFEKYTFPDPAVIDALSNTVWMQIDLTDNTPTNLAFQESFNILGLPTILLFDDQGNELSQARVTGFMRAEPFAQHVRAALNKG